MYSGRQTKRGHREGDRALLGKLGEKDQGLIIKVS